MLKVKDGIHPTALANRLDALKGGPAPIYFEPYKQGSFATAMIVTLAAGGSGVTGKLTILGHWTTANSPQDADSLYGPNAGVLDFSESNNSEYLAAII